MNALVGILHLGCTVQVITVLATLEPTLESALQPLLPVVSSPAVPFQDTWQESVRVERDEECTRPRSAIM